MLYFGIGITPNTELAQAAGLIVDNGIVVDQYARISDLHIVAAGDCTNHPNMLTDRRVSGVRADAVEQARMRLRRLQAKQRLYYAVPWFWSDQCELKLQMCGLSSATPQSCCAVP